MWRTKLVSCSCLEFVFLRSYVYLGYLCINQIKYNISVYRFGLWLDITILNEDVAMEVLFMKTSSNGNIFRVTGPLWGEPTGHWWIPLTKVNGAQLWSFFDLRLNARLGKQSRRRWFETQSHSIWRRCNKNLKRLRKNKRGWKEIYLKSTQYMLSKYKQRVYSFNVITNAK